MVASEVTRDEVVQIRDHVLPPAALSGCAAARVRGPHRRKTDIHCHPPAVDWQAKTQWFHGRCRFLSPRPDDLRHLPATAARNHSRFWLAWPLQ